MNEAVVKVKKEIGDLEEDIGKLIGKAKEIVSADDKLRQMANILAGGTVDKIAAVRFSDIEERLDGVDKLLSTQMADGKKQSKVISSAEKIHKNNEDGVSKIRDAVETLHVRCLEQEMRLKNLLNERSMSMDNMNKGMSILRSICRINSVGDARTLATDDEVKQVQRDVKRNEKLTCTLRDTLDEQQKAIEILLRKVKFLSSHDAEKPMLVG